MTLTDDNYDQHITDSTADVMVEFYGNCYFYVKCFCLLFLNKAQRYLHDCVYYSLLSSCVILSFFLFSHLIPFHHTSFYLISSCSHGILSYRIVSFLTPRKITLIISYYLILHALISFYLILSHLTFYNLLALPCLAIILSILILLLSSLIISSLLLSYLIVSSLLLSYLIVSYRISLSLLPFPSYSFRLKMFLNFLILISFLSYSHPYLFFIIFPSLLPYLHPA